MVTMARMDLSTCSGVLLDAKLAVGKRTTKPIRAGQAISGAAIEDSAGRRQSAPVTVISKFGSVEAKTSGVAKREGRIGDTIQ